jgi:L-threonylcarbamoyladenylate synthase
VNTHHQQFKTKLTNSPKNAAQFILKGELVAFPTETVYGLGANAFEEDHVQKIFIAKSRQRDNPLIVHFAKFEELDLLVRHISASAEKLMAAFFPGPLTLILPKSKYVPPVVSANLDTVAVRMPAHALAQKFLRECGVAIAAPSANISGRPSATSWEAVKLDLDGKISCILKGDQSLIGLESTVVDCTGKIPLILRSGALSLEDLRDIIAETKPAKFNPSAAAKSPGMKYRHYAPLASITLIDALPEIIPARSAYIGLSPMKASGLLSYNALDLADYAHAIYNFFRECDSKKIKMIYCQEVPERGLGVALMDRIRKAAKK